MTDIGNNRVQVFGLNGYFVRQWGGEDDGAVVSKGEVFVSCDHRVQVFR